MRISENKLRKIIRESLLNERVLGTSKKSIQNNINRLTNNNLKLLKKGNLSPKDKKIFNNNIEQIKKHKATLRDWDKNPEYVKPEYKEIDTNKKQVQPNVEQNPETTPEVKPTTETTPEVKPTTETKPEGTAGEGKKLAQAGTEGEKLAQAGTEGEKLAKAGTEAEKLAKAGTEAEGAAAKGGGLMSKLGNAAKGALGFVTNPWAIAGGAAAAALGTNTGSRFTGNLLGNLRGNNGKIRTIADRLQNDLRDLVVQGGLKQEDVQSLLPKINFIENKGSLDGYNGQGMDGSVDPNFGGGANAGGSEQGAEGTETISGNDAVNPSSLQGVKNNAKNGGGKFPNNGLNPKVAPSAQNQDNQTPDSAQNPSAQAQGGQTLDAQPAQSTPDAQQNPSAQGPVANPNQGPVANPSPLSNYAQKNTGNANPQISTSTQQMMDNAQKFTPNNGLNENRVTKTQLRNMIKESIGRALYNRGLITENELEEWWYNDLTRNINNIRNQIAYGDKTKGMIISCADRAIDDLQALIEAGLITMDEVGDLPQKLQWLHDNGTINGYGGGNANGGNSGGQDEGGSEPTPVAPRRQRARRGGGQQGPVTPSEEPVEEPEEEAPSAETPSQEETPAAQPEEQPAEPQQEQPVQQNINQFRPGWEDQSRHFQKEYGRQQLYDNVDINDIKRKYRNEYLRQQPGATSVNRVPYHQLKHAAKRTYSAEHYNNQNNPTRYGYSQSGNPESPTQMNESRMDRIIRESIRRNLRK